MSGYAIDTNTQNSKVVHINSLDATTVLQTDSTSYFSFVLEENFKCPTNQSMLISLHSATIPYSFYNIREDVNNVIPFKVQVGSVWSSVQIQKIPKGNYSANSLAKQIESALTASNTGLNGDIKVTYDRSTMKYLYMCNPADHNRFTFYFDDQLNTAHIELGFSKNALPSPIDNVGLTSENVCDVNGNIHGIYVRTNLSLDGSYDSLTKGLSTILARIPIDVNFGGVLFWQPQNGSAHKIQIQQPYVHTITIRLTDERNRLIDLNGLNFQVSIQFDFVYNKESTPIPIPLRYQKPREIEETKKDQKRQRDARIERKKRKIKSKLKRLNE